MDSESGMDDHKSLLDDMDGLMATIGWTIHAYSIIQYHFEEAEEAAEEDSEDDIGWYWMNGADSI